MNLIGFVTTLNATRAIGEFPATSPVFLATDTREHPGAGMPGPDDVRHARVSDGLAARYLLPGGDT